MVEFCQVLKLHFFSRTSYDKIIKCYIGPVVYNVWTYHKQDNINNLKTLSNIWLAGDGQYDSPGFCAKYCFYSVMDLNSSKIIDFQLVQKWMVKGDLKRAACEMLLQKLIVEYYDCKIQLFLFDRHKGIRYFFRTQHPEINHEFDIWHLSKSLMKKIKTLEKKYPDVHLWKSSINNHLWWSAQTCEENSDLLVDKFLSILYHIANIHEWTDENGIKKHEKLTDEQIKN